MLLLRWMVWSSRWLSESPLNVAPQPAGQSVCSLVWNSRLSIIRPLFTSPSFHVLLLLQIQLLQLPEYARWCHIPVPLLHSPLLLGCSVLTCPLIEYLHMIQDWVQASPLKENCLDQGLPQRQVWGKSSPHSAHWILCSGVGTPWAERMRLWFTKYTVCTICNPPVLAESITLSFASSPTISHSHWQPLTELTA